MTTTIQVSDHTLQLLKQLKEQMQTSSYDEAIHTITIEKIGVKESMAGSLKKYFKNGITKKEILEGLRDKHDRF